MKGAPVEWCSILCHSQKWPSVHCDIRQIIPNIIHESNELLNIIIITGSAPLPDTGYLVGIDMDSISVDYMTKTVDLVSIQITFGPFAEELLLSQSFKYKTKMLFLLFYGIQIDKYIV